MDVVVFWISIVLVSLIYIVFRYVHGGIRIYLPDALVFATATHAVGALIIMTVRDSEAAQHISTAALLAFISVVFSSLLMIATVGRSRVRGASPRFPEKSGYKIALWAAAFVNLAIVIFLLSNPAIAELVVGVLSGDTGSSLLSVRKAITTSSGGYMSPGLIKLLRDEIGPIVFVSFILSRPNAHRSKLLWFSVGCALVGVVLSGQRFPVVLIVLALVIGLFARRKIDGLHLKFNVVGASVFGLGALSLFYLMSYLLGRVTGGGGILGAVWWSLLSMTERVLLVVPHEAEKTYEFWSEIGPTYGQSWLSDLAILLPGKAETSFSSELHLLGGGSAQGNAPLFFAIDSWFAFGWVGIPFVSFLFVVVLHMIDSTLWCRRSPVNDAARIVLYLNVPLMYSPFLFFLYGGIVVLPIVFWTWVTRRASRPCDRWQMPV